ncbi:MAG TPA: hypothetical protein VHG71_10450 [Verrucomicrobiae bacterium]|nr:hypothetical protein [Verrucomicrobiae bacterium]
MKVCARQFNLFLTLVILAGFICGCSTESKEAKKEKKQIAALRVHIEVSRNDISSKQTVSVLRSDPVMVTIADDPILTEANIIAARIIDAPGGFAIEVQFDEIAMSLLEHYSATNPGRHFVIFGQWGEKLANGRWLAAPLITHRIANGILAFTPDCSREEANQLVLGLNNLAAQMNKGFVK